MLVIIGSPPQVDARRTGGLSIPGLGDCAGSLALVKLAVVAILGAVMLVILLLMSKGRVGQLRRLVGARERMAAHARTVPGGEAAPVSPVTFDDVALAVMRKAWHDYNISYVADDGVWVARYIHDGLAPVLPAASPEELTAILADDTSDRRRRGVRQRVALKSPATGYHSRSLRVLPH
jgi:hypothetical protein